MLSTTVLSLDHWLAAWPVSAFCSTGSLQQRPGADLQTACWSAQEALNEVLQAYVVHAMETDATWLVPQLACHQRAGRRHLTCATLTAVTHTSAGCLCSSDHKRVQAQACHLLYSRQQHGSCMLFALHQALFQYRIRGCSGVGTTLHRYSIFLEELTRRSIAECGAAFTEAEAWFSGWQGGDVQPDEMLLIVDQVRLCLRADGGHIPS